MKNAQFKKEVKRITGVNVAGYSATNEDNYYHFKKVTRDGQVSYTLTLTLKDNSEFNACTYHFTKEKAYDELISKLELIAEHGRIGAYKISNGIIEEEAAELIEEELEKDLTLEECQELKLRAYNFYHNAENGSKDYYKGHELFMLAMDKLDAKEKEPQKGEKMENMNTITVTAFKDERVIEVPTINGLQFKWQQEEAVATLESLRRRKVDLKGMNNLKNHDGFNYLTSNHKFEKARKKLALAHLSAYAVYLKEMGE